MKTHQVEIPGAGTWECWEDDAHSGAGYNDGSRHDFHMLKVGDIPVAELTRVFNEGGEVTEERVEVFEDAAERVKGL